MKKHTIHMVFLLFFLSAINLHGAQKLVDYGFEDWTGNANTTPNYIFGGVSYWNDHINASEVVHNYAPSGYNQWTPHSGNYFWLQCSSPCCSMTPSVSGITQGDVNSHNMIGYADSTYGNGYGFDLGSINTGQFYISFWARIVGFSSAPGNCKWIRVHGNDESDPLETVYMHITPDKKISIYANGAFRAYSGVLSNMQDGNWHKYSMFIDYNNQRVYQWYDVASETFGNATNFYSGSLATSSCGDYLYIQGNFSAKTPSQRAFCAVDDLQIWDGMPDGTPTTTTIRPTTTTTTPTTTTVPTPDLAWSAADQTGDLTWDDSASTWCLRLLVEGSAITQSSNWIRLGFQGRNSGNYSIRKVSIGEKWPSIKGDVVDDTWEKVTFDGRSVNTWGSDITTIPAGSEKISDPVAITVEPGQDYYVTLQMVNPSTYLIADPGYEELYFDGQDHTETLDWSGVGYSTYNARLHAVSSILIYPDDGPPDPPIGLQIIQ